MDNIKILLWLCMCVWRARARAREVWNKMLIMPEKLRLDDVPKWRVSLSRHVSRGTEGCAGGDKGGEGCFSTDWVEKSNSEWHTHATSDITMNRVYIPLCVWHYFSTTEFMDTTEGGSIQDKLEDMHTGSQSKGRGG